VLKWSFGVSDTSDVKIVVVNIVGDTIRTILDKSVLPGSNEFIWDNRDDEGKIVEGGIYLICMEAHNKKVHFKRAVKYVLMK
jgi:flagellar hook assembly protein FlgD